MEYTILHFLFCFVLLTVPLFLLFGFKRLWKNQISVQWQYRVSLCVFMILAAPFIPWNLSGQSQSLWTGTLQKLTETVSAISTAESVSGEWINDYALSVNTSWYHILGDIVWVIWIVGIALYAILYISAVLRLRKLRRASQEPSRHWIACLKQCQKELAIKRPVSLFLSGQVRTPLIFGLFHPVILLPLTIKEGLPEQEMKLVLYHELSHYKNKHIAVNGLMCFFQGIYWFHPAVWWAFRRLRQERELACDAAVLTYLPQETHKQYGLALLRFAGAMPPVFACSLTADMGGAKKQMKARIQQIAEFQPETSAGRKKGRICCFVLMLLTVMQMPGISAFGQEKGGKEVLINVVYEDLNMSFDGMEGSFVLYQEETGQYTIYGKDKCVQRISPDSTYKIYSALIGLETQAITGTASTLEWDGTEYPFASWNQNQDLRSAMEQSVTWYFQMLDGLSGYDTVEAKLREIGYGNCDFSGGRNQYWLESTLKISPVEQVELLRKLYHNQLGFSQENTNTVKDAMLLFQQNGAKLYGKTGTGIVNGKNQNGWFIGFVEKGDSVYYFALNIQGDENVGGTLAARTALEILEQKGIYSL